MVSLSRWTHPFDDASLPPDEALRLLGEKGAGLVEMTALGLPVPPGFTVVAPACQAVLAHLPAWPDGLSGALDTALSRLERQTGRQLGDREAPLLVSVRSGLLAAVPGMLDTLLDLGLNADTVEGLARLTGDARFAWETWRRLIVRYGTVVLPLHPAQLARAEATFTGGRAVAELSLDELKGLVHHLLAVIDKQGHSFPTDPREQIRVAIDAIFRSYNSHRARYYRTSHQIADEIGTAVHVQAMVFGRLGAQSGSGTAFTRDPKTGAPGLYGAWAPSGSGADAEEVAPLTVGGGGEGPSLLEAVPAAFAELQAVAEQLERHFRDMQELRFTVEQGRLHVLQARAGARTGLAAVQIAVDLVGAGLLSRDEAIGRIQPAELEGILRPVVSPQGKRTVIAKGLDASPGAATGRVVFTATEVQECHERGEPAILVRVDTSPEDIQAMTLAAGVLTARGGQTSHAAVAARGMGKPGVVGCAGIQVDLGRELFYAGDFVVRKGDWITIDGGTGEVIEGRVQMLAPQLDVGAFATLLGWADDVARLKVRANVDTGADAARARTLGAQGVGLCRTEQMFFEPAALQAIRRMILADDPRGRQRALQDVLPLQRDAFTELFRAMDGLPVTIRLLDPPLQAFLAVRDEDVSAVAQELGVHPDKLRARLDELEETNPLLGHRGVRVGVTTPELYRVQVRAIFEAACALVREGYSVIPEVLIPLVATPGEVAKVRQHVVDIAEAVIEEHRVTLRYAVGAMIEVPRAALQAGGIAQQADFLSFGTNDLTQLAWGISRDDLSHFLPEYLRSGLVPASPLVRFDVEGVGELVQVGCERARAKNPAVRLSVCGEHAGDPTGVAFFHRLGVDELSCSAFRIPVARLAAAHAALGLL